MEQEQFPALQRILAQVKSGMSKSIQTASSATKNDEGQKKNLYNCEYCKDTGYIIIHKEHQQDLFKKCKCEENENIMRMWKDTGISLEDIDKSFGNFKLWNKDVEAMKNVATNYYLKYDKIKEDRNNSILLSGNPGAGKTHLALALANNFITKKNIKVIYMPYRDVITEIKQNMLDSENYKKLIGRYQNAEILLIDDLYKGKITDSDINIMFEIINYRYINKKPMIISTEKTVNDLLGIDEAIGGRIYETCKGRTVEIIGTENDYRLR